MEEYIGKICPFCKTEIKEGDAVKVCPECGIPHHEACWEENKGCTTFGCSQQHYEEQHTNPTDVCVKCGAPLGDGQDFCPKCGTPKGGVKKRICSKCGAELQEGQDFCPKCGQKADLQIDAGVNSAISQFNAGVDQKKKKSKKLPIILGIVAVAVVGLVFLITSITSSNKASAAREQYLKDAKEFMTLSYTAASNLEDIADTIQKYWYENIWEDKHGSDINAAILYAMVDKSSEITLAESYNTRLETLYNKVKKVPDDISEKDKEEIKEICSAIKELYNVYSDFYDLATDPSGNYNSYSDKNNSTTDLFISKYNALKNLLD